jgi:hypothetical protein
MAIPDIEDLTAVGMQMLRERDAEQLRTRRSENARRAAARRNQGGVGMISPLALSTGMASIMPARQANHLQGMADDVMSAISKENYSRVAQAREMRRMMNERAADREKMQHEKDLLLMRLQAMR